MTIFLNLLHEIKRKFDLVFFLIKNENLDDNNLKMKGMIHLNLTRLLELRDLLHRNMVIRGVLLLEGRRGPADRVKLNISRKMAQLEGEIH